jgi:hypothetical protein
MMRFTAFNELARKRSDWPTKEIVRETSAIPRGRLLYRRYFVYGVPQLILRCRLLGHLPVVDGTSLTERIRWVVCARCGARGEPQGALDPDVYAVGDRYFGPWNDDDVDTADPRARRERCREYKRGFYLPGRIPAGDKHSDGRRGGQLGAEVVIGAAQSGVGFEWKVGNAGSEHTLAADLYLGWLGAVYLHTEVIGVGLQRWLNPVGYNSKIVGVRWWMGRLEWQLWSKRDSTCAFSYREHRKAVQRARADRAAAEREGRKADVEVPEPWWRHGNVRVDVRSLLLGRARYEYETVNLTGPDGIQVGVTSRFVRMPEGEYLVKLTLKRVLHGRPGKVPRGWLRRWWKRTWVVEWDAAGDGIPTEGRKSGRIFGSYVGVSARSVREGTWPAEAVAAITTAMTTCRTNRGWEPIGLRPISAAAVAAADWVLEQRMAGRARPPRQVNT